MLELTSLYLYPLKSAAALACDALEIEPRGAAHDRRWMLVDAQGKFVTGRQIGALVRLRAVPDGDGLQLDYDGAQFTVAPPAADAPRIDVTIWKSTTSAVLAAAPAQVFVQQLFGPGVRLVYMDAASRRPVDPAYSRPGDEVSFADGYPLLLLSRASLADLSARVGESLDVRRFRPNLVVDGCPAYAEDEWRQVRLGGIDFDVAKPCTRCVFTTVDPDSGERHAAGEPLATLKAYRQVANGVRFGVNLIPRSYGTLRRGATGQAG